jgi:hypothetical protein
MQIFQSEILGMILLDSEIYFLIITLVVLFVVSFKKFYWGHECKGHIFHQAMFHFSNRVKIQKTLKIVLTMIPSLHGERDVNVGSFV